MKKRIWAGMCMLLLVLLFASSAAADVLWEPNDNFYNVSRDECEILGRHFTANSKTGRTTVYNQPGVRRLRRMKFQTAASCLFRSPIKINRAVNGGLYSICTTG